MKRKYYLFYKADNLNEYYYNVTNNRIKLATPEDFPTGGFKLSKGFSTYPFVIIILAFNRKYPDIIKTPPFLTSIIIALITLIFIYGWFFPKQNEMCDKLSDAQLSSEEVKDLAFKGRKQVILKDI